jgi:hypothetical protein
MDPAHLTELAEVEQHYWWNVAKGELVAELLGRFAPAPGSLGLDASAEAVSHSTARGLTARVHDLQEPWPVPEGAARAVALLDVIEHLSHPVAALRCAREALRPEGALVLTLPAYPWLMGPWDEMLGHLRRYTRVALMEQPGKAALRPMWIAYWNSFTLPVAVAIRVKQQLSRQSSGAEFPRVPGFVNAGLSWAARVERGVMRRVSVPAGVSIVGVFGP